MCGIQDSLEVLLSKKLSLAEKLLLHKLLKKASTVSNSKSTTKKASAGKVNHVTEHEKSYRRENLVKKRAGVYTHMSSKA